MLKIKTELIGLSSNHLYLLCSLILLKNLLENSAILSDNFWVNSIFVNIILLIKIIVVNFFTKIVEIN